MSGAYLCILEANTECFNCGDGSYSYRGEEPIRNEDGAPFCSVECADEWDTRMEMEEERRSTEWCPFCGYDQWEHADNCGGLAA